MCKKQTSVSHSSTESEIISLDTVLRLDGLPSLELWDLIVSVFGNISRVSDRTGQPVNGKNKSHNKIDVMQDIDSVPSNDQSASQEALLYVFEDNEAVIKMIMKGRSPTMRHVSRTHRVALDWLFDLINLDPKIKRQDQIIYKMIMVDLGLLKSGKVELWSTIDRGNLRQLLGIYCKKLPLIVKNIFSAEMRIPQGTKRRFTMDRGNLRQ